MNEQLRTRVFEVLNKQYKDIDVFQAGTLKLDIRDVAASDAQGEEVAYYVGIWIKLQALRQRVFADLDGAKDNGYVDDPEIKIFAEKNYKEIVYDMFCCADYSEEEVKVMESIVKEWFDKHDN